MGIRVGVGVGGVLGGVSAGRSVCTGRVITCGSSTLTIWKGWANPALATRNLCSLLTAGRSPSALYLQRYRSASLDRARPCMSSCTAGTPSRTKRAKSDWSRREYFWKARFLTTGGSWLWSPMRTTRLRRERAVAASGSWRTIGIKVSISMICAASSIIRLSYWNERRMRSCRLMAACVHVIAITWQESTISDIWGEWGVICGENGLGEKFKKLELTSDIWGEWGVTYGENG